MTAWQDQALAPVPRFTDPDRTARVRDAAARLEPIFRRYAERQHMPGVAYGVVTGGELVFSHAFGVREVATQAPVDADTVFRIASMTKSFTALAIMLLRDAGRLALDQPAAAYAPELAPLTNPTGDTPAITVRQLMSMSAGWPQDDPWADRQLYRTDESMDAVCSAGVHLSNPPGVVFEYSNLGYMALGRIVTHVAGMPAIDYINQAILPPVGMAATVWNAADVPADRLANGYRWQDAAWQLEPMLPSGGDVAAFGGLFSTLRDLARWVALFLSAWPSRDEPEQGPLRRSSLREMQQTWRMKPVEVVSSELGARPRVRGGGYGFGLSTVDHGDWQNVGHGGGLPGFGSHMRWSPDHDLGVVALANVTYANVHAACLDALEQLVTVDNLPRRVVMPSRALATAREDIIRLLNEWDDPLADRLFADNFFLDQDRPHRQRHLAELRQVHGHLQPDGILEPENWLRGRWRMKGERGGCWVWISLTPTLPPRVQAWQIESVLPPSPVLQTAARRLAALTAQPVRRSLISLFAPDADLEALWDRVRLASILCGPCKVQAVLASDGATQATFRLVGPKGTADVELTFAPDGKKLADAAFRYPAA